MQKIPSTNEFLNAIDLRKNSPFKGQSRIEGVIKFVEKAIDEVAAGAK